MMKFTHHVACFLIYVLTLSGLVIAGSHLRSAASDFFATVSDKSPKCRYQACDLGKADMLNVHMVAHTHDDVGWLKTVDQYYYGARNDIQPAGVQYILDTVITELERNPNRRFIYVEIAFFYRWWNQIDSITKQKVKSLVWEGRLEFILGGWCMDDEASTHYSAIIDQHTLGFQFLKEHFGECGLPRIGWQIDPFGHSREQASLFAQFGFDGLFFGRLDYQDKSKRLHDKKMELMWEASRNLGEQSFLFTGVLRDGYGPPPELFPAFSVVMDDQRLEDYNVPEVLQAFFKAAEAQSKSYTTNHIMFTMGSDFEYENALERFKNLDKLIHYVNQLQITNGSKVNTLYSTPSCYLYALNQANQTYTTKRDDFFPYASGDHLFWTGFYTSRPSLKRYTRESNNLLQVCKQMNALSLNGSQHPLDTRINVLRTAMGVLQHHDAISGTEKQAVADDYAKRLARGQAACHDVIQDAYGNLLSDKHSSPQQHFCPLLNVSHCPLSETEFQFTVTLYNPTGRAVTEWARIPVSGDQYTVSGPDGSEIPSQMVPISNMTKNLPEFNGSKASSELVFPVSLPPLGFSTFFVQAASDKYNEAEVAFNDIEHEEDAQENITISNEFISLTFSATTGLLERMTNLEKSLTIPLSQSLLYYKSYQGEAASSSAYTFRPDGNNPEQINSSVKITYNQGEQVEEVVQVFSEWASQVIRLYKGEKYAEVEWTIGPIPRGDKTGKEIIARYTTDITNNATFYTDSNGREILKRRRDFRPTWKLNQTEEVAGNYYPVNSRIFIRNEMGTGRPVQLTVLTDRSQGGASIHDGEIELMLHRRLYYEDISKERIPLDEGGVTGKGLVVRGKHYLLLTTVDEAARQHREMAQRLYMAPITTLARNQLPPKVYATRFNTTWSGLKKPLPENIHLLTLERFGNDSVLLRLEHFFEKDEDPRMSEPVQIDLAQIFRTVPFVSVDELLLGANQLLQGSKRLQWNVEGHGLTNGGEPGQLLVTLKPMQIRTFKLKSNDVASPVPERFVWCSVPKHQVKFDLFVDLPYLLACCCLLSIEVKPLTSQAEPLRSRW